MRSSSLGESLLGEFLPVGTMALVMGEGRDAYALVAWSSAPTEAEKAGFRESFGEVAVLALPAVTGGAMVMTLGR